MRSSYFGMTAILSVAIAACGVPGGWDGLTGGEETPPVHSNVESTTYDPTLAPPRPISPISVSLVASTKPKFKWLLPDNETGARIDLCPTRACDTDVKTYDVEGKELVAREDLTPGVWFWRLVGRAAGRVGTVTSPTWELVVRGSAANGASDVPSGTIFDLNGDGRADFAVTTEERVSDPQKGDVELPTIVAFFGKEDGSFADSQHDAAYLYAGSIDDALGGGSDIDGDGISEIAFVGQDPVAPELSALLVHHGKTGSFADAAYLTTSLFAPVRGNLFSVSSAGDTDGDGWGDIALASVDGSLIARGTPQGLGATQYVVIEDVPPGRAALIGGFDANGDGLSDVAVSTPIDDIPAGIVPGAIDALGTPTNLVPPLSGKAERATAFASGDFDGDGIDDVAFASVLDGVPHLCVSTGGKEQVSREIRCAPAVGQVRSLAAADIEGDGKDELLASTVSGASHDLSSFKLADGRLTVHQQSFLHGFGRSLSVIWPGRPGKARVAAVADDGHSIAVLEGEAIKQKIPLAGWLTEYRNLR